MFCLLNSIYILGVNELNFLNLNNFNYIINCSISLNNMFSNPNYINLNLDKSINLMINTIVQLFDFLYKCLQSNLKVILLDESGKDNSIFLCIMFMMKYYKKDFETIYFTLSNFLQIHPKEYYNSINDVQYFLLNNSVFNNNIILNNTNTIFKNQNKNNI